KEQLDDNLYCHLVKNSWNPPAKLKALYLVDLGEGMLVPKVFIEDVILSWRDKISVDKETSLGKYVDIYNSYT
ncbi:MAG: hypothetical protein ACRDZY_10220, partial [Acidimicrobiales bacterium]